MPSEHCPQHGCSSFSTPVSAQRARSHNDINNAAPVEYLTPAKHAARRLCADYRIPCSELPDITQGLALLVIKRYVGFDPARASRKTFFDRVVKNGAVSEVRARFAAQRSPQREECSLDQPIRTRDGWCASAHEMLPSAAIDPWRQIDLRRDVALASKALTPMQQAVAKMLKLGAAPLTVARRLRITLAEVEVAMRCIHVHFEDLGLRAYLGDR